MKDSFKNVTGTYKNNPKYSNINDETKNVNGVEVLQLTAETNNTISSSSVFYYYNHTYRVDMSGFNDMNKVNDILEFIITTLQPDYKQAQD